MTTSMHVGVERGAFGPVLRRFRLEARMSQEQLAEHARVSVEGISALERGRRRAPYRETVRMLGDALRLSDSQRRELEVAATRLPSPRASGDADDAADNPPLPTLPASTNDAWHALPLQRTSLVGRENDIAAIIAMLEDNRLVSLTGMGGIGKTRVAIAVGEAKTKAGVRLVELAPLAPGSAVAAAVAQTLGIKESPGHPLLETLVANLRNKPLLIILDNCEHVIAQASALADALLQGCENIRILATSREPLKIAGEHVFRLRSLRVPSAAEFVGLGAEGAAGFAAIALFVERAQAVDRAFALSDENAPIVAEICGRLDGVALAIELAAARVNILPVRALLSRLDQRFRILTGGRRTALPRHQTMRALLDWSYDLLTAPEQRFFERLSIFAGGCNIAAAAAVCADDAADEIDVLTLLTSLVEKSLVAADIVDSEARYRLLESSRIYGAEKLAERGETAVTAHRHAAAYVGLAEQLELERSIAPDSEWLARVEPELENWRAALHWSLVSHGSVILGQRLAGALRTVWTNLGLAEGRQWVQTARELVDASTPADVAAKLEFAETGIAFAFSEYETALAGSRRLMPVYQELGDALGMAHALYYAGGSLVSMARVTEGEPLLRSALAAARSIPNPRLVGLVLEDIAYGESIAGSPAKARPYYAEALEIWTAIGAKRNAAAAQSYLGENLFLEGNVEAAIENARGSIAKLRELNFTRVLVVSLNNIAAYYTACDRWSEARSCAAEALGIALETQTPVALSWSLQHLGAIGALSADRTAVGITTSERAAQLLGYVDARLVALGSPRTLPEEREYARARAALDTTLGAHIVARLIADGAEISQERAVEYATEITAARLDPT